MAEAPRCSVCRAPVARELAETGRGGIVVAIHPACSRCARDLTGDDRFFDRGAAEAVLGAARKFRIGRRNRDAA